MRSSGHILVCTKVDSLFLTSMHNLHTYNLWTVIKTCTHNYTEERPEYCEAIDFTVVAGSSVPTYLKPSPLKRDVCRGGE